MENVCIEEMVEKSFEEQDPNKEIFEAENEHLSKMVDGVESIINQFTSGSMVQIGGVEAYSIGVMKADNLQWDIHRGYEGFISDAAKKLYEMIANMLKAIKAYFFGGGEGDDKLTMKEDGDAIKAKEDAIDKTADPRDAGSAIAHGPALKDETALVSALVTENPASPPTVIKTARDDEQQTTMRIRHQLSSRGKELRSLLNGAGHKSPSAQQTFIRQAITAKKGTTDVNADFERFYEGNGITRNIAKSDTVAINSLKTVKTRLDAYIAFFDQQKENLPTNFGEWSGWWNLQHRIKSDATHGAMVMLMQLCKDGSDMEMAIERDTKTLDRSKEQLQNPSETARKIIGDITAMQQVLSRECNVAGEIKSSQRKVKKALNRQIEAIERARADLVISCVKSELRKS